MDYEKIKKEFYDAFMKAADKTGNAYKNLSWFNKNKGPHSFDKDKEILKNDHIQISIFGKNNEQN